MLLCKPPSHLNHPSALPNSQNSLFLPYRCRDHRNYTQCVYTMKNITRLSCLMSHTHILLSHHFLKTKFEHRSLLTTLRSCSFQLWCILFLSFIRFNGQYIHVKTNHPKTQRPMRCSLQLYQHNIPPPQPTWESGGASWAPQAEDQWVAVYSYTNILSHKSIVFIILLLS